MIRTLVTLVAAASLLPSIAEAAPAPGFAQLHPAEFRGVRPDRAYILVRCPSPERKPCALPMLLRIPSSAEMETYTRAKTEAWHRSGERIPYAEFPFTPRDLRNIVIPDPKRLIDEGNGTNSALFETYPGRYVVYGIGFKAAFLSCMCLGSVAFDAAAGQVTDMGTFLASRAADPSPYPELAGLSGLGPSMAMDFPLVVGAIRPASTATPMPAVLGSARRQLASYRAVGPFYSPNARNITGLAPIPGVLTYERGRVMDVLSGKQLNPTGW